MCKTIIATFMVLALLSKAEAQNKSSAEFGFQAGPSLSFLYNQNPLENPRKPGKAFYSASAFGISGQYNFKKIASLRMELN